MSPSFIRAAALAGALGTALFAVLYYGSGRREAVPALAPGQEKAVLKAFRDRQLPPPALGAVTAADVLPLAELSHKRLLHRLAYDRAAAAPQAAPAMVSLRRDPGYDEAHSFDPAAPELRLPRRPRQYAYSLVNDGPAPASAPVLYDKYLWNSVPGLLASAGLDQMRSGLEKAKALHALVSRYHSQGSLPLEAGAENDPVKYLSVYGTGICDDAASAQAALAAAAGLPARTWWLSGHVVPEVFADGAWRMLDPDHRIYFHAPGDTSRVYGVEELSAGRDRFDYPVPEAGGAGPYPETNKDIYLSTADNRSEPAAVSSGTVLQHTLRPGEKLVFTSFNWGRHYDPFFSEDLPGRYYNGYLEYRPSAGDISAAAGLSVAGSGGSLRLANTGDRDAYAELDFSSPFPVAGGAISADLDIGSGGIFFAIQGPGGRKALSLRPGGGPNHFEWIAGWDAGRPAPAYGYKLAIRILPGTVARFSGFTVLTDFQFGGLPLLPLRAGVNRFKAHFPGGGPDGRFKGEFLIKY